MLIDNNSSDNSTLLLKKYSNKVNISFWKITDDYNCYRMCSWKQRIFEFYGANKKYLTVDFISLVSSITSSLSIFKIATSVLV